MAKSELVITVKIEGMEELVKLAELVGRLNDKQIKIYVNAGPPEEKLKS